MTNIAARAATPLATTTGDAESAARYVRNLCALWATDAKLALAIEAIHPDDVPALEKAREAGWTAKLQGGVYLHSRYRPIAEAEAWVANLKWDEPYAVIVGGFALGYHIRALWKRLPEDAVLVVAEPNLALLKAAFSVEDYSDILLSRRMLLFTTLDRAQMVERLEPKSVLFTAHEKATLLAEHPASKQAAPDFHRAFQKLALEFIAFTRTGFLTLMLNNVATCRNIANNMGRYVSTPPLELLHNAYAGKPAILVAAGPSLQKNMHLLHEIVKNYEHGTMKSLARTFSVQRSAFSVRQSSSRCKRCSSRSWPRALNRILSPASITTR